MSRTHSLAVIVIGGVLVSLPAASQESERSEISVQVFGSFVKTTTNNAVEQNATNSGGVLANYRFLFSEQHGVEVNYGYSRNTQEYGLAPRSVGVKANQHEMTAAYVYRHRLLGFTPFVEAGVGGLVFDPSYTLGTSTRARATFVYGAGADLMLVKRIFLRAEYRGLVYKSPTFDYGPVDGLDRTTHRAEPSVGFGYRF